MASRRLAVALAVVSLASVMSASVDAQKEEEELDRKPLKCVLANSISKREAVDQRTIVFGLKGNKFYRNDLPSNCPVLEPGETRLTYYYKTQSAKLTRLCDTDSFTVERKPGTACRLGQFLPITAEEAATLLGKETAPPAAPAAQ